MNTPKLSKIAYLRASGGCLVAIAIEMDLSISETFEALAVMAYGSPVTTARLVSEYDYLASNLNPEETIDDRQVDATTEIKAA